MGNGPELHSLIPLEDFKAILGIDDREDALSRFCLVTATYTIEQYCMRRLFLKKHFERIALHGELLFPLGEYPVRDMLAVYVVGIFEETGQPLEPDLYRIIPDLEGETGGRPEDMVYSLSLSPALNRGRGPSAVKAVYRAGYACGEAPVDLASACLELAAGLEEFTPCGGSYLAPRTRLRGGDAAFLVKHAHRFVCITGRGAWPATGGGVSG